MKLRRKNETIADDQGRGLRANHTSVCVAIASIALVLIFIPEPTTAQGNSQPSGPQAVGATLYLHGFFPQQGTVKPGLVYFFIKNRFGRDVDFSIEATAGPGQSRTKLLTGRGDKRKRSWNQKLTLPPGDYQVAVEGFPALSYALTVEP